MIKCIIFDWSGTISDDLKPSYHAYLNVLKSYGIKKISLEEFKRKCKLPVNRFYKEMNIKDSVENVNNKFKKFFKLKCEEGEKPKLLPHAKSIIKYFYDKGLKLVVVSSHSFVDEQAKEYGIDKYFSIIKFEVVNKKLVIKNILKKLKVSPKETFYVGDMIYDIRVGKALKLNTVAVLTGYHTKEMLEKEKPDFIIKNLKELKKIIQPI